MNNTFDESTPELLTDSNDRVTISTQFLGTLFARKVGIKENRHQTLRDTVVKHILKKGLTPTLHCPHDVVICQSMLQFLPVDPILGGLSMMLALYFPERTLCNPMHVDFEAGYVQL